MKTLDISSLREKAELANRILEDDTPYLRDKNIIYSLFQNQNTKLTKDIVGKQLTIIDSYYSTNMSKRYYGIEEIAESIIKVSKDMEELNLIFSNYKERSNNYPLVTILFDNGYGFSKTGERFGQARSLISKFAYFSTHFNFPIYDSIVKRVFPLITGKKLIDDKFYDFVLAMNELLLLSNIENYNKLDNLLWLIGKIIRGNYSLILRKEKYLTLVSKIQGFEGLNSRQIDEIIMKFTKSNIENLTDVFTNDQIEMVEFSRSLVPEGKFWFFTEGSNK